MINNSFHEEISPDIQAKPPVALLEAIRLLPVQAQALSVLSLPSCSWSCPKALLGTPYPLSMASPPHQASVTGAGMQKAPMQPCSPCASPGTPWKCRAQSCPGTRVPLLSRQAQVQPSCQPCFPWHNEMLCSHLACRVTWPCPGWGQPQGQRL